MNIPKTQGFASGRWLGFLILFAMVIAGIFVMNRWIKSSLDGEVESQRSAALSVPQSSGVPLAAGTPPAALQVAPALSDSSSPPIQPLPPPEENKIIYETPLNETILVQ